MEWKRNKLLILFLFCAKAFAQVQDDVIVQDSFYSGAYFDPSVHYSDSEKTYFRNRELNNSFDETFWKTQVRDLNFEEEKDSLLKTKKSTKKAETKTDWGKYLQYVWIVPVLIILLLLLIKLLPLLRLNNPSAKSKLTINTSDPDEEEIKAMDIDSALEAALKNKDYRLAYRLRYLAVLKKLIDRNFIYYRKERTNFEYLMQLSGKSVYEPFRLLTLNFDGIWYGDLQMDEQLYFSLEKYFTEFEKAYAES